MNLLRAIPLSLLTSLPVLPLHAQSTFTAPIALTNSSEKFQLSRIANGQMAFDSVGTLHAVYWSGGFVSTDTAPSHVYYTNWTSSTGWSAAEGIDDSEQASIHIGGRHASLAIRADDAVVVAWHDHRHCTGVQNWIDNLEIYADVKPFGGSFSSTDIRLSNAANNGYLPRLATAPTGEVTAAWYDFTLASEVSDIYLKSSDTLGTFSTSEPIADNQGTDLEDRGGSGSAPAFTTVDLAIDGAGTRHLVWTSGTGGGGDLYYASAAPGVTALTESVLSAGDGDFFDPAHIIAAPDGDIWVVFVSATNDVMARRKPAASSTFDASINLTSDAAIQSYADAEIGTDGLVRLVWVEGGHVLYTLYDPSLDSIIRQEQLTATTGQWARPTLALDTANRAHILFEENLNSSTGRIWFIREVLTARAESAWQLYR